MAVKPCMDSIPIKKNTEIRSQLINSNLIFFIRPIVKSVLAIYDINGLFKITNLLDAKKSGTYRSSSAAPDCIRSNSEKGDSENKQKICVQVFKPTFHETTIIFL